MTLTCGLLEAPWVDVISLDIRQNIFQILGGQILDHEVVGPPSLEIPRAQLDQVLRDPIWLAQLCSGAWEMQTSLPAGRTWSLGVSAICDQAMLTQEAAQTPTPRAPPASPFILLYSRLERS